MYQGNKRATVKVFMMFEDTCIPKRSFKISRSLAGFYFAGSNKSYDKLEVKVEYISAQSLT